MMLKFNRIGLHSYILMGLLTLGISGAVVPLQPVWAQARGLPDFPDLVDQVLRW